MTHKLYIAGPMSGLPEYNFPAFRAAAVDLRQRGHEVVSPAEMEDPADYPEGMNDWEYRQSLLRDFRLIADDGVTAIVVLPGWEKSGGASAEVALGRALKLPILRYPSLEPYGWGAGSARTALLMEAASLVDGDRNAQYGDPLQDFSRTAAMWSAYKDVEFKPHDVGVMMALLKCSRIAWSPSKRDHFTDGAGYISCAWDCVQRELEK